MKGFLPILLLLVCAGCSFDEAQEYNPELRLMFQPAMYMHVAHEDVEKFSTKETFGVCAWVLPSNTDWTDGGTQAIPYLPLAEAKSRELVVTDTTMRDTAVDTLWLVADNDRWVSAEQNLAFMAYAPYQAKCKCDNENGITCRMDMLTDQTDLLYSAPQTIRQKTLQGWLVPIYFEHALCQVQFEVKNRVEDDEKITIKSIAIDEVAHRGTFRSLKLPQWEIEKNTTTLYFYKGRHDSHGQPEPIGRYWLMLPQQLDTRVTVEYEYTTAAQTTIEQKLKTIPLRTNLKAGRNYTYTLSVGIDDVIFLEEIIAHRFTTKESGE